MQLDEFQLLVGKVVVNHMSLECFHFVLALVPLVVTLILLVLALVLLVLALVLLVLALVLLILTLFIGLYHGAHNCSALFAIVFFVDAESVGSQELELINPELLQPSFLLRGIFIVEVTLTGVPRTALGVFLMIIPSL